MHEYNATVINVVDGDTVDCLVTVEIDVGFGVSATFRTPHRVRLGGVNCPEVHGPSKEAGLAAAAYTREHLLGKGVTLRPIKSEDGEFHADSFGRWLARVDLDGSDFCERLIATGHAVQFMCGVDTPPDIG